MTTATTGGTAFTVAVHNAEEGGYWGEILELPGCMSQGETEDELYTNIRDALRAVLLSYIADGEEPRLQSPVIKTASIPSPL